MALSPTSKIENNDSEVFSYEKKVNAGSNVSYPNSDIVSHEHAQDSIFLPNPFAQNSSGNCITFYHKPAHDNGEGGVLFFIDYYPDDCYIRDSYFGIQILDFEHN